MPLPDFIIVGTCKSGSTSLHQNLRKHPDIYTPSNEVHYFYSRESGHYKNGLEWYKQHFEDAQDAQTIGEKTPMYAHVPEVPPRMNELLPGSQLVWIFRDPVQRAHSHYWFAASRGRETHSFQQAIEKRLEGEREQGVERAYLRAGLYARHVERYLEWFGADSMFFCTLRGLKKTPSELFGRLFSFLGVDPDYAKRMEFRRRKVTSHTPYSPWLRHFVLSQFGGQSLARKIEYKLNSRIRPGYPDMSARLERDIHAFYAPSNQRLQEMTGLEIAHWTR
jgi:hypothetical protein